MIWQVVFIILCCYSINTINKDSVTKHFQNSFPSFSYQVVDYMHLCIASHRTRHSFWGFTYSKFRKCISSNKEDVKHIMPVKLSTTISNISSISNIANSTLINKFYQYMKSIGTSESYQNGNLKITIYFAGFLVTIDFLH
jgi:hypothetical protein